MISFASVLASTWPAWRMRIMCFIWTPPVCKASIDQAAQERLAALYPALLQPINRRGPRWNPASELVALEPTDQELDDSLEPLRKGLGESEAAQLAVALADLENQELEGLIGERRRCETAVICALILRVRSQH